MRRLILVFLTVAALAAPVSAVARTTDGRAIPATVILGNGAVTHDGNRAYASAGPDLVGFQLARSEGDNDSFRIAVGRNAELARHLGLNVPVAGPDGFDCRQSSTLTIVGTGVVNWASMAPGQTALAHADLNCLRTSSEGYRIRWTGGPAHGAAGCVRVKRESSGIEFSFAGAGCVAEVRHYAEGKFSQATFADVSFSFKARGN